MRPDPQVAMREALDRGPAFCPPTLFAGGVDFIVLGLKAHANTISHARHVALEETFPRTLAMLGPEAFHLRARLHLADPATLRRPLARIGEAFPDRLTGSARALANVEWSWLESWGAADAPAVDLTAIAALGAEAVAALEVALHPSARLTALDHPLLFDGVEISTRYVLTTRLHEDVVVSAAGDGLEAVVQRTASRCRLGDLLEHDAAAVTQLIMAGALMPLARPAS